jgi:hypothetical protein
MHTGAPGFKHRESAQPLSVDLLACSTLLGWVSDVLLGALLPLPTGDETVSEDTKFKAIRAINKVFWIQQDLFQKHYIRNDDVSGCI